MPNQNDFLIRARRFEDQDRFDLAVKEYEQAITIEVGDQSLAYQGRSRALVRLGRLEEAKSDCQKALALNPQLHLAHSVLGYIYLKQNKYELAQEECLAALRMESRDVTSLTNLGYVYLRQSKYELAEKKFLAVLDVEPNNIASLANLAIIYTNLGNYPKAIELCDKITQLQPRNVEPFFQLVRIYLEQSRFQLALGQLNKIFIAKPVTLKIYPLYAVVLVNALLKYFGRLNIFFRLCTILTFHIVALFAPLFFSAPLGILLSVFVLLAIVVNLWFCNYKYRDPALTLLGVFSLGANCILYWIFVWIHQLIEFYLRSLFGF